MNRVVSNTTDVCKCTHWDPRCIASCLMGTHHIPSSLTALVTDSQFLELATTAIAQLLQGSVYNPKQPQSILTLVHGSLQHAKAVLAQTPEILAEFEKHISVDAIEKLELDDSEKIGYTFKCIGAGIYALKYGQEFVPTIHQILMQAGDADTYAHSKPSVGMSA